MENISTQIIFLYMDTYVEQFYPGSRYAWCSTIKNAELIFFYCQQEKYFENIIFKYKLENTLNFLDPTISELIDEETSIKKWLSDKSRHTILTRFKNDRISNWDFDTILLSCGIYYCLHEKKTSNNLEIHLVIGIYTFLLKNRERLGLYFFLKKEKILLKDKRDSVVVLIHYLHTKRRSVLATTSVSEILENFLLIWDLLEYNVEEYVKLKEKALYLNDISCIELTLKNYIYS